MKHLLSTAAVVAILAATPALAEQKKMDKAAQNQNATQSEQTQADANTHTASIQFVTSQSKNDWLSSELIGRSVQNPQGETLGDINNVVLDERGNTTAVVIGVGGFLGLGEKDVGVRYEDLEFRLERDIERTESKQNERLAANKETSGSQSPLLDKERQANKADRADMKDNTSGQTAAQKMTENKNETSYEENPQDNIIIVLNTTKEQLEAAPTFKYLGEERETSSDRENADKKQK